jgi:isochorismate synthase
MVRDAIQFIQNEGIAKVVVSRMARTDLPCDFDPAAFFASLAIRYPDAFVSLVAVPGVGSWIGASPELLLALDGDAVTTMSLAGTQPLTDRALDEVTWGRKELREQEMVSEYVRDFFAEAGVEHVEENGPRTIAAGSVVHLQTTFRARLPEPERRQLANHMLSRLHPTSAVCGMPRAEALAFIRQHEGHARRFYSGYLGPVNLDSRSYLYVNLRCTQLLENGANLYVGAGITADSDPTTEWRETELKAQTILDALTAGERVSQR